MKTKKAPARKKAKPEGKPEKQAKFIVAIGRRKEAIAIVRLFPEKDGGISINGKPLAQYFPQEKLRSVVRAPFDAARTGVLRLEIKVAGGGLKGQAEAVRLGAARALAQYKPDIRPQLRTAGFLTRDARVKERRKYGLKKARRAPQWSKR